MTQLPKATVKRLVKNYSGLRVSDEAVERISKALEEELEEITVESKKYTEHAGRKTLQAEDVRTAGY